MALSIRHNRVRQTWKINGAMVPRTIAVRAASENSDKPK